MSGAADSCLASGVCPLLQVEGSPAVVKKGVKKEEAEEIKKKLEAGARLVFVCGPVESSYPRGAAAAPPPEDRCGLFCWEWHRVGDNFSEGCFEGTLFLRALLFQRARGLHAACRQGSCEMALQGKAEGAVADRECSYGVPRSSAGQPRPDCAAWSMQGSAYSHIVSVSSHSPTHCLCPAGRPPAAGAKVALE